MDPTKPWYQSKTIIGAIVTGLATVAQIAGVEVTEQETQVFVTALTAVGQAIGIGLTIYGRVKAQGRIAAK